MKFESVLISVKDMEASKKFYKEVLGLDVIADFGANVTLTGGIALQTESTWKGFIHMEKITTGNGSELYFEEDDMDGIVKKLESFKEIKYVHKVFEHSWGQRVVRIYDPDGHIIEIGENIKIVVRRFLASGMTDEETAVRMDVPVEYIKSCM
ncbi:MAG: VOC family protein [Candidatus Metalachnospira sp.]|nr:VOC family protein [Candidatus Metalachnospira sp.]